MRNSLIALPLFFLLFAASCSGPQKETARSGIKSDAVDIAFIDTGKGDTTLLFVHGWCLNKSYWKSQIDHFSAKYRVVAIDLPGFSGASGKNRERWTTEAYAEDVKAAIDQLKLRNVILVGHSMAGDIVLEASIHRPDEVIALVGVDNFKDAGVIPPDFEARKKSYLAAIESMKHDYTRVSTEYFNKYLFAAGTPASLRQRILNDVAQSDSVIAVKSMVPDFTFSETAKLKESGKPLFLINSDYVPTDTTGLAREHVPFTLFEIHATGHFPMIEKPADFNEALEGVILRLRL